VGFFSADIDLAKLTILHRYWFQNYSDHYDENNRQAIRNGQEVDSAALKRCRVQREALRNELLNIVEQHHLSAFLAVWLFAIKCRRSASGGHKNYY
jgi:hypothetical protein